MFASVASVAALRVGHRTNDVTLTDRAGSSAGRQPGGANVRVSQKSDERMYLP